MDVCFYTDCSGSEMLSAVFHVRLNHNLTFLGERFRRYSTTEKLMS